MGKKKKKQLTIASLLEAPPIGKKIKIHGWIRSRRDSKGLSFVVLNDGSSMANLQIVATEADTADYAELLPELTTGTGVAVVGEVVESQGKGQAIEVLAQLIQVLGAADPETYPLQKKGHSMEFMRSIAHLRPRANTFAAVFRIRSTLAQATHRFFSEGGFRYVHTPIITASDCEGAGEMFEVKTGSKEHFFGRPAMLTVSGQLNAEALAYGLGRVYTFGPTFRAENSNTSRHLSEFWMVEPEMMFADIHDDMDLGEAYLKYMVQAVLDENASDVAFLGKFIDKTLMQTLQSTLKHRFVRVTYTEAIEILEASGKSFEYPVGWGEDLQTEHERF